MSTRAVKNRIKGIFERHLIIGEGRARRLLPIAGVNSPGLFKGKLYEMYVLGIVLQNLSPSFSFQLRNGGASFHMRQSPGPINKDFTWIDVFEIVSNTKVGEIWTDVEFRTLSSQSGLGNTAGEFHELDVGFYHGEQADGTRPSFVQVRLGVECKNTNMGKGILRQVLGLRRELSYIDDSKPTGLPWPSTHIEADPPSALMLFCTDGDILKYSHPGGKFSINFEHRSM
jgi:hypothetical protein